MKRNTALQAGNGKARARSRLVSIRLSHAEWKALSARARQAGDSVSILVRRLIAAHEVRCIHRESTLDEALRVRAAKREP